MPVKRVCPNCGKNQRLTWRVAVAVFDTNDWVEDGHAVPEDDSYRVVFGPALEDFPSGDDMVDARRMNEILERAVLSHPEQYLWIHRRFKRQPDRSDLYWDIPDRRRRKRR
jgi:hypothetical protein